MHADGQSQAVGRQQLQVNLSTQQQYGHQLPARNLDRLHPETLVTRRHQRSGDENLEGFREELVREERLDGIDDEEVDNSFYNGEDEQRQQLIRTLDLLDVDALIGQEREKRFEDVSREPRRETRRSHKNEGDGETEEKLEEQHNKPDPAPKHNKLKANISPPQSFSHQSLPSSEVNCHRQPSQSAHAPPPTVDDPSPLEFINAHQPFKAHWFNPGTVNNRSLYQVTFHLLDLDMVSTVTQYEKRPRGVHGSEYLQNGGNVKKTRENETEDGARSAKEGNGGYGSQLSGGEDEDASASAAIIRPAPEVAAYSPVEPILEDPAEPILETAADLLAEFVSEAAAVTAPEAATKVGENRKAEDAVEVLEADEVDVGRKVAKMGHWLGDFGDFGGEEGIWMGCRLFSGGVGGRGEIWGLRYHVLRVNRQACGRESI